MHGVVSTESFRKEISILYDPLSSARGRNAAAGWCGCLPAAVSFRRLTAAEAAAAPSQLLAEIEPAGSQLLPVTGLHAAAVALLTPLHNDPFDSMLVAQAKTEPLLLLTNDAALPVYGDCVKLVVASPRRR